MDNKDERFDYYRENPWEFIRNGVFDVQSRLVSIRGYSDLLLREVAGPINEKQREFLTTILRNEEVARTIVNSLRDLTTILWDKLRFPLEKVILTESLSHVTDKFKLVMGAKNQEFILPKLDTPGLLAYARVSISDTGIGITTEEQIQIFKLFFRSVSDQVRATPGLGTSLFLCKHYVEYFGGQIGFESEPGKGSTFWFTIPIAEDESPITNH
jgi:signal transduction histidine kinase